MAGSRRLSGYAKAYITAVVVAGIAMVFAYAVGPEEGRPHSSAGSVEIVAALAFFLAAGFIAERHPVTLPSTRIFDTNPTRHTLSSSVIVASLLLYGPAFAMLVAVISVLFCELLQRMPFVKVVFNSGMYAVTVGMSGLFLLGTGTNPHSFTPLIGSVQSALLLLAALATYYLMNTSLVAGVIALVSGSRFSNVWRQNVKEVFVPYAGMLNVGVLAAVLWTVSPLAVVLLVLPLLVLQFAFQVTDQLKHETLKALIGVAEMVDARDKYAYSHSMEVARYSNLIATKLGLALDDVEMINLAAMLHDIGKIGTPDRVLNKPGRLDAEERSVMELHPSDGAKVLQYFSLFRRGADLVLYHQEHHDGSGYPQGLVGDDIPLGARIIHVADAYQAMTSDRVYRKALPVEEAVRRLVADSGKQFDPVIVNAMLEVVREQGLMPNAGRSAVEAAPATELATEQREVLGVGGGDLPDLGTGHA